ncbi:MAG: hypothetical protein QM699_07705 [Amaricoccus sp.]|uniref:hypothetical protein n=1 Tax=Amaricoccus sp. TaxID=1872485 RepID=UPI0039E61E6B
MSLARLALRVATVEALRGRTMVVDNVRDSDMSAIDIEADGSLRTGEDRPFVLVYTDDGRATETPLRDLHANGSVDLVLELGIATPMVETDPDTGESTIADMTIPATDAAFEMVLDIIDRQIASALAGGGRWPTLWKRLSSGVTKVERRRAVNAEQGVRFAARQVAITLELKPDPVMGAPLGGVWQEFAAAIESDRPDLVPIVAGMLGTATAALSMAQVRERFGHTPRESTALGYGPFHSGGEAYVIAEPEIDGDPA